MKKQDKLETINQLSSEIKQLIADSKQQVAFTVNIALSMLYWHIGKRINEEVLQGHRAEYGKQTIQLLCDELVLEHGTAFSEKNIRRMMQFAEAFPNQEIVVSLIRQLSWTHILAVLPITDTLKRSFYIELCTIENARNRIIDIK